MYRAPRAPGAAYVALITTLDPHRLHQVIEIWPEYQSSLLSESKIGIRCATGERGDPNAEGTGVHLTMNSFNPPGKPLGPSARKDSRPPRESR